MIDSNYEQKAEKLLVDINVYLSIQSATEVDRLIFEDFSPHFASVRGMPLALALAAAYEKFDASEKINSRKIVSEAFDRCVNQKLGIIRTMVIVELEYSINREKFNNRLWLRLSERFDDEEGNARWRGDLILFFIQHRIGVDFSDEQIVKYITLIEIDKLKSSVYYFVNLCDHNNASRSLKGIKQSALDRLHDDVKLINEEEVDFDDLRSYILSISEHNHDDKSVQSEVQQCHAFLDYQLKSEWLQNHSDPLEEIWPSCCNSCEDDF